MYLHFADKPDYWLLLFFSFYFQEGRTPLHFAAQNGHLNVCHCLLQHGCHPDDQDNVSLRLLISI